MNTWFVIDNNGNLIGFDMKEAEAKEIAKIMQEEEPEAEWKALNGNVEEEAE